jgi:hypothetical protein
MTHLYTEKSGALFSQSVKSGAEEIMPAVLDVFWADIYGQSTGPNWTYVDNRNPYGDLPCERGKTGE